MAEDSTPVTPPPAEGSPEAPTQAEPDVPAQAEPDLPADTEPDLPSAAELERIATPATVRRAPRYRAFAVAGVLVGAVVGVVLVLATSGRDDAGVTGFALFFVALGCAVIGAIVGGVAAVVADRRSTRSPRT